MREKTVAAVVVGLATVAMAAGLAVAAAGGIFDAGVQRVAPPPIDVSGVAVSGVIVTPSTVTVPPSPTWQIAPVTTPRPTTNTTPPTTEPTTAPTRTEPPTTGPPTTEPPITRRSPDAPTTTTTSTDELEDLDDLESTDESGTN